MSASAFHHQLVPRASKAQPLSDLMHVFILCLREFRGFLISEPDGQMRRSCMRFRPMMWNEKGDLPCCFMGRREHLAG